MVIFASKYGPGLLYCSLRAVEVDAVNPFREAVALYSGQRTVLEQALYERWVGKMVKGLC